MQADVVISRDSTFTASCRKASSKPINRPSAQRCHLNTKMTEGWTINSATLNVIGYNTKLVPPSSVKSFWDLTDPRWKGQLLMDENESKWMAEMTYYGEAKVMELMRKLAGQEIQFRVGHTLIQTLAAAGERHHCRSRLCQWRDRLKGWCAHRLGRRRSDHRSHLRSRIGKDAPHPQRRPLC